MNRTNEKSLKHVGRFPVYVSTVAMILSHTEVSRGPRIQSLAQRTKTQLKQNKKSEFVLCFLKRRMFLEVVSDEDFGERVGPCAGDERFGRVEGNVENALIELLPVRGDLLNTRLRLQVPQTNAAVVAWNEMGQIVNASHPIKYVCLVAPRTSLESWEGGKLSHTPRTEPFSLQYYTQA